MLTGAARPIGHSAGQRTTVCITWVEPLQFSFSFSNNLINNVRLFIGLWGLFNPSVMDNLIEQALDSPRLQRRWRLTASRVSLSCEKEIMKMHEVLIHNHICRHGLVE